MAERFSGDYDLTSYLQSMLETLSRARGFDISTDKNFDGTPARVAKLFWEMTEGYSQNPEDILKTKFPADQYDQMIVVKDIKFYSLCAHHLAPFFGSVSVGYLPNKELGDVIGLSKIPRLVRLFSRRFQIQERMTQQIAECLHEHLNPRGVGVLVHDSQHLCSHMRGIEESHSTMTTSHLLGEFRDDPAVRDEFFRMCGK